MAQWFYRIFGQAIARQHLFRLLFRISWLRLFDIRDCAQITRNHNTWRLEYHHRTYLDYWRKYINDAGTYWGIHRSNLHMSQRVSSIRDKKYNRTTFFQKLNLFYVFQVYLFVCDICHWFVFWSFLKIRFTIWGLYAAISSLFIRKHPSFSVLRNLMATNH